MSPTGQPAITREHREAVEAVQRLRAGRWVRVRDRGRELVVGTRSTLAMSRGMWAVGGGVALTAAVGVVFLLVQVLVLLGWLLLVPAGVVVFVAVRAAVLEASARGTMRRRDRGRQARAGYTARVAAQERADAWEDAGGGAGFAELTVPPEWGGVSRRQPALPRPDRSLPASPRRALS